MADYNKVGLLATERERMLLCRKTHTTSLLILPGGCLEAGESALQCLERELHEELGEVTLREPEYVGTYVDQAAGAPEKTVQIELYRGRLEGEPRASSEIRELVWFSTESDDHAQLSPILRNHILPDLIARGLLP